jgi:pimeloyl-ACP methyl ester carboxylesterase
MTAAGYNYNTFAGDLYKLINHLKLCDLTLVGFSMGGGKWHVIWESTARKVSALP